TGVRWTALALLTTMSMPPKVATVRSIALFTCVSSRTSTTSGSACPPALAISSAAVKMVPESFGCGFSGFAPLASFGPARAGGDGDGGAVGGGAQGNRKPDAARCTGDEQCAALERHSSRWSGCAFDRG